MLLDIQIANFRSIGKPQTLSLLPVGQSARAFSTGATHEPYVLPAAGIFGPNASGKSNIINAISYLKFMATETSNVTSVGDLSLDPFLLANDLPHEDTSIEVKFAHSGVIWRYGFAVGKRGFAREWLLRRRPRSPETVAFEREGSSVTFGSWVRGEKEAWKRDLLPSQSLLAKLRYSASNPFTDAVDWLTYHLRPLASLDLFKANFSAAECASIETKKRIIDALSSFDVKVNDIKVDVHEIHGSPIEHDIINREVFDQLSSSETDLLVPDKGKFLRYDVRFERKFGADLYGEIPFKEESTGTRYLFKLAGPLLDILDNGYTVIIDEIDSALHSDVLRAMVDIFNSSIANPKGAQLIFTAHDLSVLNDGVLEKDQIWFVEKGNDYATSIISLADFVDENGTPLRRSAQFARQYLSGRFGAKPNIDMSNLKRVVARVMETSGIDGG